MFVAMRDGVCVCVGECVLTCMYEDVLCISVRERERDLSYAFALKVRNIHSFF